MEILYIFIVLAVAVSLFCLIYYLNSKTKKPDNCSSLPEECESCKVIFCRNKKTDKDDETKEK